MSKIRLYGDTSGYVDLTAPAVADNRSIELSTVLDSKLPIAGGKILQVVRATDATQRTTTSTSFTDASISVTITPSRNDSSVFLLYSGRVVPANNAYVYMQITDASNNAISGAEAYEVGVNASSFSAPVTITGYATPATTSATTYKVRYRVNSGTGTLVNNNNTAEMYAFEVSA